MNLAKENNVLNDKKLTAFKAKCIKIIEEREETSYGEKLTNQQLSSIYADINNDLIDFEIEVSPEYK